MESKKTRGQALSDTPATIQNFVVIGVFAVVGLLILTNLQDNITDPTAIASANDTVVGISELTGFFGVIGLIIGAVILLNLVLGIGQKN